MVADADWIIDGRTDVSGPITIDGELKQRGLIPRDFQARPPGCYAVAPEMPEALVIPEDEWAERLAEQQANRASLFDLRERQPDVLASLDQDGYGYCWAFSTTKSVMYSRAVANQPGVVLSAWAVGAIVKNYRDQGGWCTQSLEFISTVGVPSLSLWPQGQVDRRLDTAAMRVNAALHRCTEWWDGSDSRERNRRLMVSAFLLGFAPVLDFNWWGHSVCGCRLVSLNPLTIDIDNSWTNRAGNNGIYRLVGDRAMPDGLCVPRVSVPSVE